MSRDPIAATEVFKALGDPIRWNIIQQIAQEENELACSTLENTLPVSKPTISYHTKILTQAGLIEVRKRGRNYFYALRRDMLSGLIDELWALAPGPRLVDDSTAPAGPRRAQQASAEPDVPQAELLTW
jgi:DNA-binding transcriptional ArsR family regulator